MKRPARLDGFSLVELMVTLAIMGTLAMVALPMIQVTVKREKEHELRYALIQIREALDAYKRAADQGLIKTEVGSSGYPATLEDLVKGVPNIKSPQQQPIYFLRRLPRDPFFTNAGVPAGQTWGLRSYASSYDLPQEGVDVFDVYSLSEESGLNGVPYREW